MYGLNNAYPSINAHSHGNPSKKCAAIASTRHSTRQGDAANLNTVKDNFLKATGSSPSPARINITVKAICLKLIIKMTVIYILSWHLVTEYMSVIPETFSC